MAQPPGPKELELRRQREEKFGRNHGKKPSSSDLRKQVAKIKPVTRHGGRRGG